MKQKKPLSKKTAVTLKVFLAILILVAFPFLFVFVAITGFTLLTMFFCFVNDLPLLFAPNPPEPIIQYGEFPFEIVYSINDETFTKEGIVVCEYEGVVMRWSDMNVSGGKKLKWNTHIKGTDEYDLVIYEYEDGVVYCDVGEAHYYLGYSGEDYAPSADLIDIQKTPEFTHGSYNSESIKEKYNIEIISYKFSPPIENTFK